MYLTNIKPIFELNQRIDCLEAQLLTFQNQIQICAEGYHSRQWGRGRHANLNYQEAVPIGP